ncbi:hypothetical protein TKK_0013543 [Trichogramma kaykai]|uniref:Mos1 transposase HTH domain-containing protein n=1 Tax=Trichogramma kaykai TaxID=54128 RepID=A0ABD2WIL5_9HYME
MDRKDQRVCIKFCVKNEKSESEIYEMLQKAYGKASLSRYIVYEWVRCFKKDRDLMKEDLWSGKHSASCSDANVDKLRRKIQEDRRLTARELAEEIGIPHDTCQAILTVNLGLKRLASKLVPRFLSDDEKIRRWEICSELKRRAETDPLFTDSIITGDEMWIYGCDPESKTSQHNQYAWRTPTAESLSRKLRQIRATVRTLLIVFFDSQGIVHQEFVPQSQSVNQAYYRDVLTRLREKVRVRRAASFRQRTWYLHCDTALSRNSLAIQEFLAEKKIACLPHPYYSPDLTPCDFFLFPRVKLFLKGKTFDDVGCMKRSTLAYMQSLQTQDYQACFQKLQERWAKCMESKGEYVEAADPKNELASTL